MDKWLTHPTALKILSVLIALMLWAVVHFDPESNPNATITTNESHVIDAVKIKTIGLDEKTRALRAIDPGAVKLVVSGSRARLAAASPDDYVVSANLSDVPNGVHEVVLSVELPRGVELVKMTPNRATVQIEPMQTKEFEVQVLTEGAPANGYKAGEPIVKPNNRVHVTLPEDELETVGAVAVNVNVNGEEETVSEKRARVIVYDNDGKELKDAVVSPSVVEVEVPITKPFKQLPLQIGFTGALPAGLSIAKLELSTEQVTVYGPQNELDKLEFYDGVIVDLDKVTGSGTYTYDIKPIDGIAAVDPKTVSVSITVEETSSRLIERVPVTLSGLADGMSANVLIPTDGLVDVTVRGAPTLLTGLKESDVQAVARLESLGVGQHEVTLDIHLPNYVSPDTAPVKVTVDIIDDKAASTKPKDTKPADKEPPAGPVDATPVIKPEDDEAADAATDAGSTNSADTGTDSAVGSNAGSSEAGAAAGTDTGASSDSSITDNVNASNY
ncbi:YbbR family protein [Paenibacillus curdlanolyticus YK9]|uniref:YbbR family protein n=1 Tax=Paenibacillus curdlanolyticus YK9 TaxID=717606 RepID=E0I8D6_9BACL|nr:CdaR family protein [Paenibacillus curdlanolyticus]EFM11441.1 YbbR family protein [Paenibacillus curdlanolyticus YK9]